MGKVTCGSGSQGCDRRRLVAPGDPIVGALLKGERDRLRECHRKLRREEGIERSGIHRSLHPHPAAQLQSGDGQSGLFPKERDSGAIHLEQELERIGLHHGPAHDSGPGDDELLLGPSEPIASHVDQLPAAEDVVVVDFGPQCREELGLNLGGLRDIELGVDPAKIGQLPAPGEQLEADIGPGRVEFLG